MDLLTLGEGGHSSPGVRRRRASTFSSPTTLRHDLDRVDSSSDPGHGHHSFSTKPQTVPIEHLRPFAQGSITSRNEAGLSYAETSSATQSFVSMNSQSGPTDTPHPSTHSVHRLTTESDSENQAGDSTPPGHPDSHPPIQSGDDTVRQVASVAPRSSLPHVIEPHNPSAPSVQKIPVTSSQTVPTTSAATHTSTMGTRDRPGHVTPFKFQKPPATGSENIPTIASGTSIQDQPAKESIYSQKVKTPATQASQTSTSQKATSTHLDQQLTTSTRKEPTTNIRSHLSDAITPATTHPSPPINRPKDTTNSQRLSAPLIPPPPQKAELNPSSSNGAAETDAQGPPLPSTVSQMDTQYVSMLLALDDIPVC